MMLRSRRLLISLLISGFFALLPLPGNTATSSPLSEFLTADEIAWLKAHPEIRVGTDRAWAPFEFVDESGTYNGIASEYLGLLGNMLSVQFKPTTQLPWSEVIDNARNRELDILSCVVETPQRTEFLTFTRPYLDFPMVIMTRDDAPVVDNLGEFTEQTVGIVAGYASADLISNKYPDLELVTFKSLEDGLTGLSTGKVDAFVDNLASISHVIRERGLTNLKVAAKTPFSFKLGIGVRQDWPELSSILDKALARITPEQHAEIQGRWISIRFDHGVNLASVLKYVAAILAAVLVGFILMFYRQRTLKAELKVRQQENLVATIAQTLDTHPGQSFFATLTEELVKALKGDFAFIGVLNKNDSRLVHGFAVYGNNQALPDFEYRLDHTPCDTAVGEGTCVFPSGVTAAFPDDEMLQEMGAEGYIGVRMEDSTGEVIGIIALLSFQELKHPERATNLIRIFARRAASEIERRNSAALLDKLSLAVEFSPNAVVITDCNGLIEYVNPKFTELTGFSDSEMSGQTYHALDTSSAGKESDQLKLLGMLNTGQAWRGENSIARKDGSDYWASEHIAPIIDADGKVTNLVIMQQDITEARAAHEKISYQATHDMLTRTINRAEFENRLQELVRTSRTDDERHSLCYLDLDRFKVVNDTCGHLAGDEILRQIASILNEFFRQTDTVARLGGDEFAILMNHCDVNTATRKLEELRIFMENFRFSWEERIFAIGISMGLCEINETSRDTTDCMRKADLACYTAKQAGRNRLHVYDQDDELLAGHSGEMQWVSRITSALEKDLFTLYAQPIKPILNRSAPVGYEILIRMIGDDGEILPPGFFLNAAERYNLVGKLDRWVIDTGFRWIEDNLESLDDVGYFSFNLSGQSIGDEKILTHITEQVSNSPVPETMIRLEITETAAISNLTAAQHFINTLREHGVQFSLDDFGSGLSSFGYLKNLPVDHLKIDGMFVKDMLNDPIDAAMVRSINDVGHVMGKTTIAEFVENPEIEKMLESIGVDCVQGYGVGIPMPLEDVLTSIRSQKTG